MFAAFRALRSGFPQATATQTQLDDIARLLNGRPRQTLNLDTPEDALAREIQQIQTRVALDS
ncbi:hypothetical protein [Niveibacterium terrae]|uniref:hypothetical protein n=1 Tax=Niveibacterium terrae TaxID=3373598 RepID=UPI003A9032DA